jgi:hypothetical protein
MASKESEWPTNRDPAATFVTPDGYLKSGRSLAGPLRMGTAPGVGPKGAGDGGNGSDFGTDRISPRGFDPMGTDLDRTGSQEPSERVKRNGR